MEILRFFFSFILFETGFCYLTQAGLKLLVFQRQPPEWWDYLFKLYFHATLGRRDILGKHFLDVLTKFAIILY